MSQSDNNIKNQIIDFYNDPLFQKLNAYYGKTTVFNILKIERNENRHSAFLAWLFDKNGSHGLGEEPIKRFMRLLAKANSKYDNPFVVGNYRVENVRVRSEHLIDNNKRIDVYITFDYFENGDTDNAHQVCIIIENKVYTEEHNKQTQIYYNWAKKVKENKGTTIIGVFLSPDKEKTCSCQEYIKIDYQELLVQVIEPLLALNMSDEAKWMISDYIVNLGQPKKLVDENGNEVVKEDTILAVSMENTNCFLNLYQNYTNLLDASLFTFSSEPKKRISLNNIFEDRFDELRKNHSINVNLLNGFWEANEMLLRMILDTGLNCMYEGKSKDIAILLEIKASNRDNTKYLVYAKNGDLMNKGNNGKAVPKSVASYYIFKAWLEDHPKANLSDIRDAFKVEECAKHYSGIYKYLFYKKTEIDAALINNKTDKTYFNATLDGDDENIKKERYLLWNFFTDDKYCLEIQDENVLSIKSWHKDEFDNLVEVAKKHGIEVVEQ